MRLFQTSASRAYAALPRICVTIAAIGVSALIGGCGNNYRPAIIPVGTNGPAAQVSSYAVVVSTTGTSTDGIVTIIDYSGDSVMDEVQIGPGPTAFTLDEPGVTGYTINSDGSVTNFSISTFLQAKNLGNSTLPSTAQIVNLMPPSAGLWAADLNSGNGDVVDIFSGSPEGYLRSIQVTGTASSSNTMSMFVAGSPTTSGEREYVISQNVPDETGKATCNDPANFASVRAGVATPIEFANTADTSIPVGKCPVYAVQTPDLQRLFVLNRGDDTITVINTNKNTLDQCLVPLVAGACPAPYNTNQNGQPITYHPVLPLSTTAITATGVTPPNCDISTCGMGAIAGPVYAEYNAATRQLVVANYDGGTISIIDVSLDENGNDSSTFGTTYTVPVGNTLTPYPASVTVLYDGSKAYTANQNDDSGTGNGTVTVVDLSTHLVEETLTVVGHPRTVVNTQNSEYSKVYVASPDSPYITIIKSTPTETDVIDKAVPVVGTVVDVRVNTQNGSSGNSNYSSRVPGYGQPCNLSPGQWASFFGSTTFSLTLAQCQLQALP